MSKIQEYGDVRPRGSGAKGVEVKDVVAKEAVGFLGLGVMGRPMAENLAKKYEVWGFDPQESRFQGIAGVRRSPNAAALAGTCRVLCLSLPSAEVVEGVLLGPEGLIHHLEPGSLILDFSTGLPAPSRKVAQALASRGVDYADVPVSGGESGARAGSLAIMVGASEAVFSRCQPYLGQVGKSVVRAGEVGAGNVAKLVNNMIVGVTFSVIAEGFAVAVSNGLDPNLLHKAIRDGWAGSQVLEVSAPAIASGQYLPGGTVDMIQKDLGYADKLAEESGVSVPMTGAARVLFGAAQEAGWGAESQPAIFKLWKQQRGAP